MGKGARARIDRLNTGFKVEDTRSVQEARSSLAATDRDVEASVESEGFPAVPLVRAANTASLFTKRSFFPPLCSSLNWDPLATAADSSKMYIVPVAIARRGGNGNSSESMNVGRANLPTPVATEKTRARLDSRTSRGARDGETDSRECKLSTSSFESGPPPDAIML